MRAWQALIALVLLCGCEGSGSWQDRYGLDASISPVDLETTVRDQQRILKLLTDSVLPSSYPLPAGSQEWYLVAETGYNFIDQKCDMYLYDLYVRSKRSGRAKGLISAADKATSAILAAEGVSGMTIGVVAAIFGFGSAVNDAVAESYLLAIGPSTVSSTIKKLQDAYRQKSVESRSAVVNSVSATSRIRGYLQLCMPVYIEGQITDYVSKAGAGATDKPKTDGVPPPSNVGPAAPLAVELQATKKN